MVHCILFNCFPLSFEMQKQLHFILFKPIFFALKKAWMVAEIINRKFLLFQYQSLLLQTHLISQVDAFKIDKTEFTNKEQHDKIKLKSAISHYGKHAIRTRHNIGLQAVRSRSTIKQNTHKSQTHSRFAL